MSNKPSPLIFVVIGVISSIIPLFWVTFPFFAVLLYITKANIVLNIGGCAVISLCCSVFSICSMKILSNVLERAIVSVEKSIFTEEEDDE